MFDCVTVSTDYPQEYYQETSITNCRTGFYAHSPQQCRSPCTSQPLGEPQKQDPTPPELRLTEKMRGCRQVRVLARHTHKKSFCSCCEVTTFVIRTPGVYLQVSWQRDYFWSEIALSSTPLRAGIWITDSLLASLFCFHPLHYLPLALQAINIS